MLGLLLLCLEPPTQVGVPELVNAVHLTVLDLLGILILIRSRLRNFLLASLSLLATSVYILSTPEACLDFAESLPFLRVLDIDVPFQLMQQLLAFELVLV
jgi:hypothetical protein